MLASRYDLLPHLMISNTVDQFIIAFLGLLVSAYSIHVEVQKHKNPKYVAMCDFNQNMSCSRVLTSKYSRGFGLTELMFGKESQLNIPNCAVGVVFFTMQMILGLSALTWAPCVLFYMSIISCVGTVYLAFILFFVLNDICIVCITTYAITASLMYLNYHRYYMNY